MTDDSQEKSLIRFGRAMKQVKGLWFLGCGLIMLVVWGYLWWCFGWSLIEPPPNPFLLVLYDLMAAGWLVVHPTTTASLYPITMFALIAIGLFRLVRSLRESRH
jgi:hypothetical protein